MQGSNQRLEYLLSSAHQAMAEGRRDKAIPIWNQILQQAPSHPHALFFLGQDAMQMRDFARARQLLTAAAAAAPREPGVHFSLAAVRRAMGDIQGEWDALEQALKIDPHFFPARLAMGMALEKAGKTRQAARIYKDALAIAPSMEQLSPEIRTHLAHADVVVKETAKLLETSLSAKLDEMKAHHSDAQLRRFEECRAAALGTGKIYTQQPHMLHFPEVPAIGFYDNADFPWLPKLEAGTDVIREELLAAMREDSEDFQPYLNHSETQPLDQWAELNRSPKWSAFYLWRDGVRVEDHCRRCPRTAALLESLPMLDMPGHGPTFLFSCLAPNTHIPAHTGDTNVRLVVHLPLIVPPNCRFRVGNETREWEIGKAWIFDDTIDHEAWNGSDQLRVILMCDVWNPYLNAAEREMVGVLLNGIRNFYNAAE